MQKPTSVSTKETNIGLAASNAQWELVHTIAKTNLASKNDPEHFGEALLEACRAKKWDIVELLLNNKNMINNWNFLSGDFKGYFSLHFLVLHNQTELIKKMLGNFKGVINKQIDPSSLTALTLAAQNPQVTSETLACLLDNAPDLNINLRQDGQSALEYAANTDQRNKVKILIEKGADLTRSSKENTTIISLMANKKKWNIVRSISETGHASKNDPEAFGDALLEACRAQQWDIANLLLDNENMFNNWKFSSGSFEGYYPLHFLVLYNQTKLIKKMLMNFKDVINNQLSPLTLTALTSAAQYKQITPETLTCLLENAPDIAINLASSGRNALHRAARTGQTEKVISLIQYGADVTIIDSDSNLAFEVNPFRDTIKAIAMQHLIQTNSDLKGVDLTGVWILTNTQLDYVLQYKKTLEDLGCKLHFKVNVLGMQFEQFGLPCQAFSVTQYTNIVFGYLPNDKKLTSIIKSRTDLQPQLKRFFVTKWERTSESKPIRVERLELPKLFRFYSYDPHKSINDLTNGELILFTKWLRLLLNFFHEIGLQPPKQLEQDTVTFERTLENFVSREIVGFFAQQCKTPLLTLTTAQKQESSSVKEIQSATTIAQLFKTFCQFRDFAFEKHHENTTFQLYLYLACAFTRLNYPQNLLFSEHFNPTEIGVGGKAIDDFDLSELIMLRTTAVDDDIKDFVLTGNTLETVKIFVIDEIIDRLRAREAFLDPLDGGTLSDEGIKTCLNHPKIRQALQDCHQKKLKELFGINKTILTEVNNKFMILGETLWNASTDSGGLFDEYSADKAVEEFHTYISTLDRRIVNFLNMRQYYVSSRNRNTTFEDLFNKATYNVCSGQLGSAIKQWAKKFRDDNTLEADTTPYSKFLKIMPKNPKPMFTEMPEGYKKTDQGLSAAMSKHNKGVKF